jgi:uncharacterized integral membrane protein
MCRWVVDGGKRGYDMRFGDWRLTVMLAIILFVLLAIYIVQRQTHRK